MDQKPVVYILHGEDDYAIAQFVAAMEEKMGDPATAGMNVTRLESGSFSIDALMSATYAMPFLVERRLVVLTNPLSALNSPTARSNFTDVLARIPPTTALALVITRSLTRTSGKTRGQHWLLKWAAGQGGRVYVREFALPQGAQMERWIQSKARERGGEFSPQAAQELAHAVDGDPRLAVQEIEKLLAYVNYRRPVDIDDLEQLTPYTRVGNVFHMVDALGNRQGRRALQVLHQLLEEEDPLPLFGMIVRQFRLLLLTRELLDSGHREVDITHKLHLRPFVTRKLMAQVRNFTLEDLEAIYRKLVSVDEAIKTSQMEADVALDVLVAALTS